jgi:hypothetical protein
VVRAGCAPAGVRDRSSVGDEADDDHDSREMK